jgi:hypothetical protein
MINGSRFVFEKTKSWWFLTPIFELDHYNLNFKYLLNLYLKTEDYPEYDKGVIILHYDYAQSGGAYARLEQRLQKYPGFIRSYEPDAYSSLFIIKVPSKWYNDYLLFINGKYSEMSQEYKNLAIKFFNAGGYRAHATEINCILTKSEERRQYLEEVLNSNIKKGAEVASILDWETETYGDKNRILHPLDKVRFLTE